MLTDILLFLFLFVIFFLLIYIGTVVFSVMHFIKKQEKGEAFCDNHPEVEAIGFRSDFGTRFGRAWLCEPCLEAKDASDKE